MHGTALTFCKLNTNSFNSFFFLHKASTYTVVTISDTEILNNYKAQLVILKEVSRLEIVTELYRSYFIFIPVDKDFNPKNKFKIWHMFLQLSIKPKFGRYWDIPVQYLGYKTFGITVHHFIQIHKR